MDDQRAFFIVSQATQLIAAGGRYKRKKLEDVVEEVILNMESVGDYLSHLRESDEIPGEKPLQ